METARRYSRVMIAVVSIAMIFALGMNTGQADAASKYIGKAKAKTIAIKDAGVKKANIVWSKVKLDRGKTVKYEVDFKTETTKYDYDINAVTGAIVKKETEAIRPAVNPQPTDPTPTVNPQPADPTPTVNPQPATTYIGEAKAKEIALADAGVASATFIKVELDKEDGVMVYDVEFKTETTKYDYDINAVTGAIVKKETKAIKPAVNPQPATTYIGEAKAKEIALAAANVASATFIKIELDRDDGIMIYEVEFRSGNKIFECDINAKTGQVLDFEVEYAR